MEKDRGKITRRKKRRNSVVVGCKELVGERLVRVMRELREGRWKKIVNLNGGRSFGKVWVVCLLSVLLSMQAL